MSASDGLYFCYIFSFSNLTIHLHTFSVEKCKTVKSRRVKVRRKCLRGCCNPLACNVVAASRRRGFHKGSGGRQTSKFPQNCLRAYTPACVKPLVSGSAFIVFPLPIHLMLILLFPLLGNTISEYFERKDLLLYNSHCQVVELL